MSEQPIRKAKGEIDVVCCGEPMGSVDAKDAYFFWPKSQIIPGE